MPWLGFATMCIGMFMAILDVQVVATSLPTIQGALGITREQISWVQTCYLIAEVISIPLTGLLTRLLTMRWMFVLLATMFVFTSIGCALSTNFTTLIIWRTLQGLAAGPMIPAVFSAVFLLFPFRLQGISTTVAGVLALLAPTAGPIVGGWITQTYSWHWLFLINVLPGLVSALIASRALPSAKPAFGEIRKLDLASLCLMSLALTALEIALKEAPEKGWLSPPVVGLLTVAAAAGAAFTARSLGAKKPIVELRTFGDTTFTVGCLLSFVLGIGIFGSIYMMPVFLGYVRGHGALEIGTIMLVTGVAQLATAPIATALERRMDARLLTACGFLMFAIGLGLSALQTEATDFKAMFWPQVVRGIAMMFCLLPPTRLALGQLAPEKVPDASGLFNLMRNLGGAIGIAMIDSIIYGRAPVHAKAIIQQLLDGNLATAKAVGIPPEMFAMRPPGPLDASTRALIEPMISKLAFVQAMNEAWAVVACLTFGVLFSVLLARSGRLNDPSPVSAGQL